MSADQDAPTGHTISIYTRNLNRVTDRLGVVQAVVEQLACESAVLDGEVLGFFGDDDAPGQFQDTIKRVRHPGLRRRFVGGRGWRAGCNRTSSI